MLMSGLRKNCTAPGWRSASSIALALATPLRAQVIWEPVSEEQAQHDQILAPMPDRSSNEPLLPQAIIWEPVPTEETSATDETTAIVWTPVPESEAVAEGSAPKSAVVIPNSDTPLSPDPARNLAEAEDGSTNEQEARPLVISQEAVMPPRSFPSYHRLHYKPLTAPLLSAMAWWEHRIQVPNGFRWSRRWLGNATIRGISRRRDDESFLH